MELTPRQAQAVQDLADIDVHTWHDIGPELTCNEAETFAEFLQAFGRDRQASILRSAHASGDDDPTDQHHARRSP